MCVCVCVRVRVCVCVRVYVCARVCVYLKKNAVIFFHYLFKLFQTKNID